MVHYLLYFVFVWLVLLVDLQVILLLNFDLCHLSVIGFHLPVVLQILLLNLDLYHLSVICFHLPVVLQIVFQLQ